MRGWMTAVVVAVIAVSAAAADKTLLINDFENQVDLNAWEVKGPARLVTDGATHGTGALEVSWDNKVGPTYLKLIKPPADWSGYDAMQLDVLNPGTVPVPAEMAVGDKAFEAKPGYWTRHNGQATFAPGKTTWTIPVRGLYRGETGFRNRDIKRDIDPDSIVLLYFGFGGKGAEGKVIIDNLRLVKVEAPKGMWAFDFGPASQAVMLGWTAISPKSRYDPKLGYGFASAVVDTAARDTTFGPALIRDCIECGGVPFRVDVPEGKYTVMIIYENSGFWGGDQSQQSMRTIEVDGKVVWKDEHRDGAAHALYRFENVEPLGDVWDTYMAPELAKPIVFDAVATKDGLTIKSLADVGFGSRISAMAIYKSDDAEATAWLKGQLNAVADDFRKTALCLDKPAEKFDVAAQWQKLGLVAWPIKLDDDVKPTSTPPADSAPPDNLAIAQVAVQGEYEPLCVAIRPMKDLGTCQLRLEGGSPDVEAQVGVVWYGMSRAAGAIAYQIQPHTLRSQSSVALPKDVTREVVVTCRVRDEAKAGDVAWTLVIADASGNALLRVPLKLSVHAVKLDRQTDFEMGFYGLAPLSLIPKDQRPAVLEDSIRLLQQHGMNGLSGAANYTLKGFKDGQPDIDFTDMDAFAVLAHKYGFTGPIDAYAGGRLVGINDGYQIGKTGQKLAEQTGLSYEELLMRTWKAVDEHARMNNWPLINYVLCDETRIRAEMEAELQFMALMGKVSKAFPKTLRTDGAYSVNFNKRPEDKNDILYWQQRYFETLDASTLNLHDDSVLAEAAKLGKEIHIYNQGLSSYSFGLYQWSEYRKGVKARWQWHLNDLYGYQFFDLDGWTNDEMMIFYGRNAIYPAVAFERCRDGAQDFYLYQTLWNLVQKGAGTDANRAQARALLENKVAQIKVNQRQAPEGCDPDQFKAQVIAAIESLR